MLRFRVIQRLRQVNDSDQLTAPPPNAEGNRELRKRMGNQARELARTALEVEQLALLDEDPFEEGFFLPEEEARKRYTAGAYKDLEIRRNACLYMLGRNCPVEDIAMVLRMNKRTVAAIAQQHAKQFAGFTESFAMDLMASAAADFAAAEAKKSDASYLQLTTGGGIKVDKAIAIKGIMSLSGAGAGGDSINVGADESEALKKFRAGLAAHAAAGAPVAQES